MSGSSQETPNEYIIQEILQIKEKNTTTNESKAQTLKA
jgi:hypothetical protein